ncbi:four helix bundle protein [Candidatus Peregrinibacteria bacterium]|nr:four helix bundle protein [Candidatus Peregrinibacteria bacterium]
MDKKELEKRTLDFSIRLIKLLKTLPNNQINNKISEQLFKSGTSIGANYREANAAESPKDFQHKIGISSKESRETNYWLDLLKASNPLLISDISPLWLESDEFRRIFGSIYSTCKRKFR